MEQVLANSSAKTRTEKLGGREYRVAQATLIVPGVLDGSRGPMLYPLEEITKNPAGWNHMPLTVEHPVRNGQLVSAREADMLDKFAVGFVLRAEVQNKLDAELWFDVERTKQISPRVWADLEAGRALELSTGLGVGNKEGTGTFNGRQYISTAVDYQPDHVAVLPFSKGACSIADGCGIVGNEAGMLKRLWNWLTQQGYGMKHVVNAKPATELAQLLTSYGATGQLYTQAGRYWYVAGETDSDDLAPKLLELDIATDMPPEGSELVQGEGEGETVSEEAIREAAEMLEYGQVYLNGGEVWYVAEADAPDEATVKDALGSVPGVVSVLYELEAPTEDWKLIYPQEDVEVKLEANARKAIVAGLIANCAAWKSDEAMLSKLSDDKLLSLKLAARKRVVNAEGEGDVAAGISIADLADFFGVTVDPANDPVGFTKAVIGELDKVRAKLAGADATAGTADDVVPTGNQKTDADWFRTAPASVQNVLRAAMDVERETKEGLVAQLTANVAEPFRAAAAQMYMKMQLPELKILVPVANQPTVPSFLGAGLGVVNRHTQDLDQDDILLPPAAVSELMTSKK